MNWFRRLFSSVVRYPAPPSYMVPDYTGSMITMDAHINAMWENTERPAFDDLIIELIADNMGATVRKEIRYRVVKDKSPFPGSICAERIGSGEDSVRILHIFYMRKHSEFPRVWFLLS